MCEEATSVCAAHHIARLHTHVDLLRNTVECDTMVTQYAPTIDLRIK